MRAWRSAITFALVTVVVFNSFQAGRACGPESIEPIFVFKDSPDPPFADYAGGKIGILQPTHGRKTLFIAYRYLNGGAFTADEQQALVEALSGKAPEEDEGAAVKEWIAARAEVVPREEKLPEIYTERRNGGYDFFPNCAKNAFEVATATLKERSATYGSQDPNVRAWLAAQDTVFQNCDGSAQPPAELGPESPAWLRKDRAYQIAAANFYALNFDDARGRFEKIAQDTESDWQRTANYLVARTLVRQASLTQKEPTRHELYDQAERQLRILVGQGGKFENAARNLFALVKYRVHPERRVRELAQILGSQNADENLRQDLIDYSWLMDKLESHIFTEEAKRQAALKPVEPKPAPVNEPAEVSERRDAVQNGNLLDISIFQKGPDGNYDYAKIVTIYLKGEASENEALQGFEIEFGRKLSEEETKEIKERYEAAVSYRKSRLSPNYKWGDADSSRYEGCNYDCQHLALAQVPDYLRADDLSDWIFTLQTQDPKAFAHALARWRATAADAWLVIALTKAEKSSPGLNRLLGQAAKIQRDSPAFPSIAYHLVRLKLAFGQVAEARKMLDEIISWQSEYLPVSTQNQFIEQRMQLATSLDEFLKLGARKPAAFYEYGRFGKISDLFEISKRQWDADDYAESKEEYEQQTEKRYQELLLWDGRLIFDDETVDVFNWYFSLEALASAARNPALPDYLQRRLVLAGWTRAIVLRNDALAQRIAPGVIKVAPEMSVVFNLYLNARTAQEREYAALYVLLKFPGLSPLVAGGVPEFETAEGLDYYFETSWWCTPSATEYDDEGKEVPKVVPKPVFVRPEQFLTAQRERNALIGIGEGKSYLGKKVLRWAAARPDDPRIPEALFIAVKANQSYKYGCEGWESDEVTRKKAEDLLRTRYPVSPWTAKLGSEEDNQ